MKRILTLAIMLAVICCISTYIKTLSEGGVGAQRDELH